jgi:DNA adenine methylase
MEALQSYDRPRATPFLKWAGGKKQLLDELEERLPPSFSAYHEPFVGGGALFFDLYHKGRIRKAFISDSNVDLINAYVAIRDSLNPLLRRLSELQRHAKNKSYFYGTARKRFNEILLRTGEEGDVEKAGLLFYLNKTCYNGLYRVNSKGGFNVPWGGYNNPRIFDERNLRAISSILNDRGVEVSCADFEAAAKFARRDDFVYLDPPYQPLSTTASFAEYTPQSFGMEDQERVADVFHNLAAKGCHVMLSNSPLVEHLYNNRGYKIDRVKAIRAINCIGTRRGAIDELLVTNYLIRDE